MRTALILAALLTCGGANAQTSALEDARASLGASHRTNSTPSIEIADLPRNVRTEVRIHGNQGKSLTAKASKPVVVVESVIDRSALIDRVAIRNFIKEEYVARRDLIRMVKVETASKEAIAAARQQALESRRAR